MVFQEQSTSSTVVKGALLQTSYLSFFLHTYFLHTGFPPHKFRTKTAQISIKLNKLLKFFTEIWDSSTWQVFSTNIIFDICDKYEVCSFEVLRRKIFLRLCTSTTSTNFLLETSRHLRNRRWASITVSVLTRLALIWCGKLPPLSHSVDNSTSSLASMTMIRGCPEEMAWTNKI